YSSLRMPNRLCFFADLCYHFRDWAMRVGGVSCSGCNLCHVNGKLLRCRRTRHDIHYLCRPLEPDSFPI
ncbi:hypothetical protein PENTCL1PPCAC_16481, partial [Pristionchus entomophagus]